MSRASRRRAAEAAAQAAAQARARQEADDRRYDEERKRAEEERQRRQTYDMPDKFYGLSEGLSASAKGFFDSPSNKSNPTVRAAGADMALNAMTSAAQRESDVEYSKAMTPYAIDYQRQSQDIASAANERQIRAQGEQDYRRAELESGTRKYEADQTQSGIRYAKDRDLEGTRYVADQDLAGEREGYQSAERQIGLTGKEERETQEGTTRQVVALRRDARGAIAQGGRRFYA